MRKLLLFWNHSCPAFFTSISKFIAGRKNNTHTGNCALCAWGMINEIGMIHPEDLQTVNNHFLHCNVLRVNGVDGEYIRLGYGRISFRAKPEIVRKLNAVCDLDVGDSVVFGSSRCVGEVMYIIWHHKIGKPYFYLSINGKRRAKRYWREDLDLLAKFEP